eukprot:TRINITY_DN6720_c0_g1_i1.p1 TRINITY_DN6720_c0_g1~~TRINITY_DN6720_c0_g1_i1.p1  ORF type:complete len:952 (+),score=202.00 TRINITY_DN6720_c0_g1_i1:344-2857(+)
METIQWAFRVQLALSGEANVYPGTNLEELSIRGLTLDSVADASAQCLSHVLETVGSLTCGLTDCKEGDCRVRMIVPQKAAKAIIGPKGSSIMQLRNESGMFVHIVEHVIPIGPFVDTSEQVVCLDGPVVGLQVAILTLFTHQATLVSESWYSNWATKCHCGIEVPGLDMFSEYNKGKGKGKVKAGASSDALGSKGTSEPQQITSGRNEIFQPWVTKVESGGKIEVFHPWVQKASSNNNSNDNNSGKEEIFQPWVQKGSPASEPVATWKGKGVANSGVGSESNIGPAGLAVKLLVSPDEGGAIVGRGGIAIKAIAQETGSRLSLSGRTDFYPGTGLQELRVLGPNEESVLTATHHVLAQMAGERGYIDGGMGTAEVGTARVRVVVPTVVVKAIIGKGGENIRRMRAQTGMHVHVDETVVPPGPPDEFSEQVVCLNGALNGAPAAVGMIVAAMTMATWEPWFAHWVGNSYCGKSFPGLALALDSQWSGKGHGKAGGQGGGVGPDGSCGYGCGKSGGGCDGFGGKCGGKGYGDYGCGGCGGGCGCGVGSGEGEGSMTTTIPRAFSRGRAAVPMPKDTSNEAPMATGCGMAGQAQYNWDLTQALACQQGAYDALTVDGGSKIVDNGNIKAIKMLLSDEEAMCISGQDGNLLSELQATTSTAIRLGDGYYPGSTLRELTIQSRFRESLLAALGLIMETILVTFGVVASGDTNVEEGGARVKIVVPTTAGAAIIGSGGHQVKLITMQCGVRVCVDAEAIPSGDRVREQAVLLAGPAEGVHAALNFVLEQVTKLSCEKDLGMWASHTNAGVVLPGFALFRKAKGKGKDKGGKEKGKGAITDVLA